MNCIFTNNFYKLSPLILLAIMCGCKKFIQTDVPKTQITTADVYASDAAAISAINGIYSQMISGTDFASGGLQSMTILGGLSADELINYSPVSDNVQFYQNALTSTNGSVQNSVWGPCYKFIYYANAVLEGLSSSTGITSATKNQLKGEALFVRAFHYFYLVNLFGDVPLITTTDYTVNSVVARSAVSSVYKQITADLDQAQTLLTDDYPSGQEKARPNKAAVTALLSRVALFQNDWATAERQASAVIGSGTYTLEPDLNRVFLANSSEAIWQLKPTSTDINTNEGNIFILTDLPNNISLDPTLYNSFDSGDNRRSAWISSLMSGSSTYYYSYKYKVIASDVLTEYSMVLRLAELYLIRAEARLHLNDIPGAQSDLNVIRHRAGLPNTNANISSIINDEILKERKLELFTEWGHRWLDLKRTGEIDKVMNIVTGLKGGIWLSSHQLFPIPQSEIINDKNLTQNPGY